MHNDYKHTEEFNRLTDKQKEKVGKAMLDLRMLIDGFYLEEVEALLEQFKSDMKESFCFHPHYFPHRD